MVAYGAADFHAASMRVHHEQQAVQQARYEQAQYQQAQYQRQLVQGLIALRPKKRANKLSWVVFAGCAYFVAALMGDHSVREALFAPHAEARAAQYAAAVVPVTPAVPAPQRAPVQVQQPVEVQPPAPAAALTFAPFAVTPDADAQPLDGPLPHAKAHHTAPTHRAHPRGAKHAK